MALSVYFLISLLFLLKKGNFTHQKSLFLLIFAIFIAISIKQTKNAKFAGHCMRKPFGAIAGKKFGYRPKYSIFGVSAIEAWRQIWRIELTRENSSTGVLVFRKQVESSTRNRLNRLKVRFKRKVSSSFGAGGQ